jgi:hypothetical protein
MEVWVTMITTRAFLGLLFLSCALSVGSIVLTFTAIAAPSPHGHPTGVTPLITPVAAPFNEEARRLLERTLDAIANQPFGADREAALRILRGLMDGIRTPIADGTWTPAQSIRGAVPSVDREPGVAAPGFGIVNSP